MKVCHLFKTVLMRSLACKAGAMTSHTQLGMNVKDQIIVAGAAPTAWPISVSPSTAALPMSTRPGAKVCMSPEMLAPIKSGAESSVVMRSLCCIHVYSVAPVSHADQQKLAL